MGQDTARIGRLVAEEIGACCEEDLDERLAELDAVAARVPADPSADLAAMKALGNDTRYLIVRLLVAAEGELCVCELTALLDVSDSAVSHALSDLDDAGLVERRKQGTWRYYRSTGRAERIVAALDATRGDG